MNKATKLSALSFLTVLLVATITLAQPTIDGSTSGDSDYTLLAEWTQANTGFGDHGITDLLAYVDDTDLYIFVVGEIESNFNELFVFIGVNSQSNVTAGTQLPTGSDVSSPFNSFNPTLDFDASFGIRMTSGNSSNAFPSIIDYRSSGNTDTFLTTIANDGTASTISSGAYNGVIVAYDDTGDLSSNTGVEGFEIKIPLTALGAGTGDAINLMAVYGNDDFMSANTIPEISGQSGTNLGSDPDFDSISGSQHSTYSFVTISGDAGWRLLSIPKSSATAGDISDDGIGAQFTTDTDSATIYTYDDTGSFEPISSSSSSLVDGHGLAVYFFDNTTAGSSELPITLDASGAEPTSDVVVDMYSGATGRYTLVGNPFAANVDLANVSANIAISSNMTFWDNTAGSYTTESTSGGLVIQPWQGYWVQTSSSTAGGQLTFGTADKTTTAADTTHFDKVNPNSLKELSFSLASSYNTEKNLKLQIADDASLDFDSYDLLKLGSLLPQNVSAAFLGRMDGEEVLKGIEGIPSSLDKAITLPVMVDLTGESQTVKLTWEGLNRIPDDWSVQLHDYETDQNFDLRTIEEYNFEIVTEGSKGKVNPVTVLRSSFTETVKAKSGQSPRLGLTITPNTTSVNNEEEAKVNGFELSQNYPNPFNPTTTINYSVENAGQVTISVYNLMGQKVAELVNESKAAGSYNVTWNAANAASGMYYYRLEAGGQSMTRKMTLIK